MSSTAAPPPELALEYRCQLEKLPPALRRRFVQLAPDASLSAYLERARQRRHGRFVTTLHRCLRGYLSDFEINGLLGTYPMHVLGTEQWRFLLEAALDAMPAAFGGRLLDVGAGNGDVTAQLAPLFERVVTTELSRTMVWRLRRRGFRCVRRDVSEHGAPDAPYDAIACLNVLDRCERPLSLLAELRTALADGGLLIVALVLPYQPFVYAGATSRDPSERLPLAFGSWEQSATSLCQEVLEPLGLSVLALTRAPYLSGGDARRALYELDDVVVVCRALGQSLAP